jgi:protein-S-isoprenylcysteine O-methyltransferase Ste14
VAPQIVRPKHRFGAGEAQAVGSLVVTIVIMAVALFWPAGTLDWTRGWIFFGVFIALTIVAMIWIWRTNPELYAVRRKYQKGTKAWDAVVATLTIISFAAILPVAGFDERFRWAPQPDWVVWLGYGLTIIGYFGVTWAQSVNRHFEATVRIQTDRDHKVIDTGPYAIIRHPGYITAVIFAAGIALSLGSLYALIPAGVLTLLLIGRTLAEDATLKAELTGYRDYAARVKQRWIPGVW